MNYLNSQFQLTRQKVLSEIEGIQTELFDIQPNGFNNTIHWHIGHILTSAEKFLLGYPETNHLPANYDELFGYGSKPAEWKGEVPNVETLVQQLQEQVERILAIPEERYSERLPQPFLGLETVGELFTFALFHESNHLGQIHAMKRVIDAAN